MVFRKTLDDESKDATKCGVARQGSKMAGKEEITERGNNPVGHGSSGSKYS